MGLLGGLLTLPLAPARGLLWVLDQVVEEAEAQLYDPVRIRAELAGAARALETGEIDDQTYEALEDELLARLAASSLRA
jgi:Gas vesicle protein G